MNIGLIIKNDFFEICLFIKRSYELINKNKLKFITLEDNENIDILIIDYVNDICFVKNYIKKLNENSIVLINTDDSNILDLISEESINVISYGFNQKSSITISSFESLNNDTLMLCIQRNIETIKNTEFVEQEFIVNSKNLLDAEILIVVSALIVLGFSSKEICKMFLIDIT